MSFARSDKPPYKNFRSPSTRAKYRHWRKTKTLRYGEGATALALMRSGAVLRCEHVGGRTRWSCGGFKVAPFVVRHLLKNPNVVALADGLLGETPQTFVHACTHR
jgi:hypothetical protein